MRAGRLERTARPGARDRACSTAARREVSGRAAGAGSSCGCSTARVVQGRRPLVVAFDGKTGEKLWARDHYASYGPNPVIFAAHLPTAVHDLDGDGADDWLVCSENFYGVISVKDNRDLVAPVVLSDALAGHWTAYSYPSLGKVRATGEPGLLHNNSYSLALDHRPARQAALAPRDDARHGGHLGNPGRRRRRRRERVPPRPAGRPDPLLRRDDAPRALRNLPARGFDRDQPKAAVDPCRWSIDLKCPASR